MRSLANLIQSSTQYYFGLPKEERPDKLSLEDMQEVLKASTSEDDVTAVRLLAAVYAKKFSTAQKEILNIQDGFGFISKLLNMSWFVLNNVILKGSRHSKVWGNRHSLELVKIFNQLMEQQGTELTQQVQILGIIQDELTQLKFKAQSFALPEQMAVSSAVFRIIQLLKAQNSHKKI